MGMLVLFAACTLLSLGSATTYRDIVKTRCLTSWRCAPSPTEYASFARNLTGTLVLPTHTGTYTEAITMNNIYNYRFPSMVVMAHSTEDIQKSVLFVRKYNLPVTIRSSGHDFLGRSTGESSFMINLAQLKGIDIRKTSERNEAGEITVGAGNTWREIYQQLDGSGRVVVGGSDMAVSPSGYTLGGGHSPLSRSLGLAVDNVLEMTVVLSDGRIAKCSKTQTVIGDEVEEDGDLFWAMTGGGGGTFGIVSHFTFKLHLEPESLVQLVAIFPMKRDDEIVGRDILNRFHQMIKRLPREYHGYGVISNAPKVPKSESGLTYDYTGTAIFSMLKFGPWSEDTMSYIAEFEAVDPELRLWMFATNVSSFWEYQKTVPEAPLGRYYPVNSLLQNDTVSTGLTDLLIDTMFENNREDYPVSCTYTLLGGKVSDVNDSDTAVHPGFRSALASLSCSVDMFGETPADRWTVAEKDPEREVFGRAFGRNLRRFGFGEYLNEPDPNNDDWILDYWYDKYPRLLMTKLRYDGDNFFTCKHCVGSTYTAGAGGQTSGTTDLSSHICLAITLIIVLFTA